jgi:hypothetical protein
LTAVGATLGTSAFALSSEHYCQGANVGILHGCGGADAHTPASMYVEVTVSNTGCAGVEQGYGGDYYYPGTPTVVIACTAGAGTNGGNTGSGPPVHGAVLDQTSSPYIHVTDAHISW